MTRRLLPAAVALLAVTVSCAPRDPVGSADRPRTPSIIRENGVMYGSGNRAVVAGDSPTASPPIENTMAADSSETTANDRGGVTYGSGN